MNLKKLQNWIRWLIFFPVATVALFVTYPIIQIVINLLNIIYSVFSPIDQGLYIQRLYIQLVSVILGTGISGFAFVWCGAAIAPHYQFIVAIIMTALYGLLTGIMLSTKILLPYVTTVSWFQIISIVIAGTVGAIIACYSFKD